MPNKVLIIGEDEQKILNIIASLVSQDDDVEIALTFTTDETYKDIHANTNWQIYINNDDLYLACKNNALLCVETDVNQISKGVMLEDFENSNVVRMTYRMFNNITPKLLKGICIAWVDDIKANRTVTQMMETKEFMENSKNYPTLYFTNNDDPISIAGDIYRYLIAQSEFEKEKIISKCN